MVRTRRHRDRNAGPHLHDHGSPSCSADRGPRGPGNPRFGVRASRPIAGGLLAGVRRCADLRQSADHDHSRTGPIPGTGDHQWTRRHDAERCGHPNRSDGRCSADDHRTDAKIPDRPAGDGQRRHLEGQIAESTSAGGRRSAARTVRLPFGADTDGRRREPRTGGRRSCAGTDGHHHDPGTDGHPPCPGTVAHHGHRLVHDQKWSRAAHRHAKPNWSSRHRDECCPGHSLPMTWNHGDHRSEVHGARLTANGLPSCVSGRPRTRCSRPTSVAGRRNAWNRPIHACRGRELHLPCPRKTLDPSRDPRTDGHLHPSRRESAHWSGLHRSASDRLDPRHTDGRRTVSFPSHSDQRVGQSTKSSGLRTSPGDCRRRGHHQHRHPKTNEATSCCGRRPASKNSTRRLQGADHRCGPIPVILVGLLGLLHRGPYRHCCSRRHPASLVFPQQQTPLGCALLHTQGVFICPATSYSPTQSPMQYHRRCRA